MNRKITINTNSVAKRKLNTSISGHSDTFFGILIIAYLNFKLNLMNVWFCNIGIFLQLLSTIYFHIH